MGQNKIIDLMHSIFRHTHDTGPVLKDSIPLHDQNDNHDNNVEPFIMNNDDESNDIMCDCTTAFGGSSQTETQLSTARLAIDNAPKCNEIIETSSYYKHALPVFEDMMNSCKTKKQFEDLIKNMETQHFKHVSENGINMYKNTQRSNYMFGQNDTNQRSTPRKKFAHEKRQQYNK